MIAARGASANNEDAKALPIVNRPEVPSLVPASWTTPPDVFDQIKRKQLAKHK